MTEKKSARQEMLAYVGRQGWVPDPTARITSGWRNQEVHQDPCTFLRDAKHGGQWRLTLDYRDRSSYGMRYDNRLRGASIAYIPVDAEVKDGRPVPTKFWLLKNTDKSRYVSTSYLWEVLDDENLPKPRTMRERAELLIKDPDTAVWLAAEAKHRVETAEREMWAARRRDLEERERPLPVTVSQDGHDSEWAKLKTAYRDAAKAVYDADGKTDLPAVISAAKQALADIEAVVKKEEVA